jgi:hypothetical protein
MSQAPAQAATPAKVKTVKIRMKPGCGRMLIGRMWRLSDGSLSETIPDAMAERQNPEDVYLEARGIDREGQPLEGPVAEVPENIIKRFLAANGKPSRVIDGYKMVKYVGQEEQNQYGDTLKTRTNFAPGIEIGAFDDSTFEIVRD